jgi:hypothetical protein
MFTSKHLGATMRSAVASLMIVVIAASTSLTQSPRNRSKETPANQAVVHDIVKRMMAFDKNKDGKLTRDEITDRRLLRLFDRADADKDGVVTRKELVALATQMVAEVAAEGANFGPGNFGPGGFGPPFGQGGKAGKGPGGFGGPPRPGQIMPLFIQNMLQLSDAQKKQVDDLQREVDAKLENILTERQKKQLKEMRRGGSFGPKPPPGGPRGADGPPR